MTGIDPGELEWLVTFYRGAPNDDGFSSDPGDPVAIGDRWAKKSDASDGERVAAAAQQQSITTRFLVYHDDLTSTLLSDDLIECEGVRYEITGTKEARGRRVGIEITAAALRA